MPFYQIESNKKCKYNWTYSSLVYTNIIYLQQSQFIILIFEDGHIGMVKYDNLQVFTLTKLTNNGKLLSGILSVASCDSICFIQTNKENYMLVLQQLAHIKEERSIQISPLQFEKHNNYSAQYCKLTTKCAKIFKQKEMYCVKLFGRINQQLYYYFCHIKQNVLLVKEYYRYPLPNQYKVSIESLDKNLLIYQSYINKFKPIKIKVLHYYRQNQSKDTSIMNELQIVQFQQRCVVNAAYLIGLSIVGLVTNSHLQSASQSNIILYNYRQKYTINNVVLKGIIITQAYLFGNIPSIQYRYNDNSLALQCIALSQTSNCLIQIYPLCTYNSEGTPILPSNYHCIRQNEILTYLEGQRQVRVHSKISKGAIYLSWLRQKYSDYPSIFKQIMLLLD